MIDEKISVERLEGLKDEIGGLSTVIWNNAVRACIREVNELAEESNLTPCYLGSPCEYQNKDAKMPMEHWDNGWIPCSERLPEVDGNTSYVVLVCTVDGFQHMAFWCDDKKWRYCESGMIKNPMDWTEIIAWQPLPAPYQTKE